MQRAEREILRGLAGRVRELSELPVMATRRQLWRAHNALQPGRPLILAYPEGAWEEVLPPSVLQCQDGFARAAEYQLRQTIYQHEHIDDDQVIDDVFMLPWQIAPGDYGVQVVQHSGENRGSYRWDAPLKNLDEDLALLTPRRPAVDRAGTRARAAELAECFDGLLRIELGGTYWWTLGLTWEAIKLTGLEQFMLAMYDNPQGLHRLMAWLRDEHLAFITWCEREGLLALNNRNGYTGSGGVAYTDELPQADWRPGMPVRLRDIWGFAESQETSGVSPHMFAEFILPYQAPLLEKFGLNCYGCCEALHERWEYVRTLPRLRRISVSPWCDQARMAEALGAAYIYSRKAAPMPVCVSFDERAIVRDLAETRTHAVAQGCVVEIILKDTHTVQGQPERIGKWVRLARRVLEA